MLFACYIKRQHVKFMVRLILLFNSCCLLCIILRCHYKVYWYISLINRNKPFGISQTIASKSSGKITLTIDFSGNVTAILYLLWQFGTKSDGVVKLIYVVYKVKQCDSAVCYRYSYNEIGCNLSLIVFTKWNDVV